MLIPCWSFFFFSALHCINVYQEMPSDKGSKQGEFSLTRDEILLRTLLQIIQICLSALINYYYFFFNRAFATILIIHCFACGSFIYSFI